MNRRAFFKGVAGLMVPAALGLQVDPDPIKRYWALDQTMVPAKIGYWVAENTDFGTISYFQDGGLVDYKRTFMGLDVPSGYSAIAYTRDDDGVVRMLRPGDPFTNRVNLDIFVDSRR